MPKILVIEMTERDINSVKEVDTIEKGIEHANELLKSHMEDIDRVDEFENEEDITDEWEPANGASLNAWCNYNGINWDAHVYIMPEPGTILRVVEPDADGCGTDVFVFVQFQQKLDDSDLAAFATTISEVKCESIASGDPYSSLGELLEDAIEVFQCTPHTRKKNLEAEVIAPVNDYDTDVEI